MKAVILAAGRGLRIREHHQLPKGFIKIDEQAIIIESIEILKQHGINEILIVTGYDAQHYEQLAKEERACVTVKNEYYSQYGSLYSLYCAKDWVDNDFLLLESDIIYEAHAIRNILNNNQPNIILVSGETNSTDEIYVEVKDQYLINMSKKIEALNKNNILGEFVGINKLSFSAYRHLINMLENKEQLLQSGNYDEDGLVELTRDYPIYCLHDYDLSWCEIDNLHHLQRAKQLYPKIRGHVTLTN